MGFPIRKSADQSFFAAPHGLSQRSTSFIASQRQGIHRTPLRHLITLIINAHPTRRVMNEASFDGQFDQAGIDLERPACFEIDPTAPAVKQKPTNTATRRPSCDEPCERCWRMRARARLCSRARMPGTISSSRCHKTRGDRHLAMRAFANSFVLPDEPLVLEASGPALLAAKSTSDWWSQTGSNRRPPACKAGALPTELWPQTDGRQTDGRMVMRAGSSPIGLRFKRSGGPGKI